MWDDQAWVVRRGATEGKSIARERRAGAAEARQGGTGQPAQGD